ncbi:T9SS type A sorting domain-containing protein [Flavobacterium sp.]|uniref:T9SS type A sorting domain-containing protein n=1 Tax=Flavobacterium sp. TaxID=239 RepID=UPI0038FC67AA
MKTSFSIFIIFIYNISFAQLTDSFTGTGSLITNGWYNHNGVSGQIMISPGSLNYSGLTTFTGNKISLISGNTEDVNKSIGTPINTTAYYSVVVNVPNTNGLTTVGSCSLHFANTEARPPDALPLPFLGKLYFKTGSTLGTFNIGVYNYGVNYIDNIFNTIYDNPTYATTDFSINNNLFVVVKYEVATNTASLFINPILNSNEPTPTAVNSLGIGIQTTVGAIAFRQYEGSLSGTGNIEYSNLRVADNWAYVTNGTLGTQKNSISGLKIYPNPAKNLLNITSDSFETKTVAIYNVLGAQVLSANVTNAPINVASLSKGVYVVKITEEGKTATRKLVIE